MLGTASILLIACGASPTAGPSAQAANSPTPSPSTATKLSANADACALVTPDDATSILGQGQLKPGAAPTAEPASGGPPTMLSGSSCYYHGLPYAGANTAGLVQVLVGRFTTSATAHDGLLQLLATLQGGPSPVPVSGLGDEAFSMTAALPAPASGTSAYIYVRKGSVDFMISAALNTGHGTADLPGAVLALAQKVVAEL